MSVSNTLTGAVALCSLAAAIAWFVAAIVKVRVKSPVAESGYVFTLGDEGYELSIDGVDIPRTTARQSLWNRIAAGCACGAAAFQTLQACQTIWP
jgi:hypothetical protein